MGLAQEEYDLMKMMFYLMTLGMSFAQEIEHVGLIIYGSGIALPIRLFLTTYLTQGYAGIQSILAVEKGGLNSDKSLIMLVFLYIEEAIIQTLSTKARLLIVKNLKLK